MRFCIEKPGEKTHICEAFFPEFPIFLSDLYAVIKNTKRFELITGSEEITDFENSVILDFLFSKHKLKIAEKENIPYILWHLSPVKPPNDFEVETLISSNSGFFFSNNKKLCNKIISKSPGDRLYKCFYFSVPVSHRCILPIRKKDFDFDILVVTDVISQDIMEFLTDLKLNTVLYMPKKGCNPFYQEKYPHLNLKSFEELCELSPQCYSKAKINLFFSTHSHISYIPPGIFFAIAAGAFTITGEFNYLSEIFEPGEHLETFTDYQELKDKIFYYLDKPHRRYIIAEKGREFIKARFSLTAQLKKMASLVSQNVKS